MWPSPVAHTSQRPARTIAQTTPLCIGHLANAGIAQMANLCRGDGANGHPIAQVAVLAFCGGIRNTYRYRKAAQGAAGGLDGR
jgi:hypothetical protein